MSSDSIEALVRRGVSTPLTPTPGDFGLDRLWLEIRADQRRRMWREWPGRVLRWLKRDPARRGARATRIPLFN